MLYAVCTVPVAPIRTAPDHKTEMSSQLLFGEYCTTSETTRDGFVKITARNDGYEGWCQLYHLTAVEAAAYNTPDSMIAAGWINDVLLDDAVMRIPFGSTVHAGSSFGGELWNSHTATPTAANIRKIAFSFLNTPYLWGGRSVFGTDCSGFTQTVFRFFNIMLQRDAHQQATQGIAVDFLQQARCGDLAFFDNEAGEIIHVGMLLDDETIIHASGKVQVDHIDNSGIVHKHTGQRMHRLRIIKRYF